MRSVINHQIQRTVEFTIDNTPQLLSVGLIRLPVGLKPTAQPPGANVTSKILAVFSWLEVNANLLSRLEALEPKDGTPPIPKTQLQDVLGPKRLTGREKALLLGNELLTFVEHKTLIY